MGDALSDRTHRAITTGKDPESGPQKLCDGPRQRALRVSSQRLSRNSSLRSPSRWRGRGRGTPLKVSCRHDTVAQAPIGQGSRQMRTYIVAFKPISSTPHGLSACSRYTLPPFIDGSCRREPDLQSAFPSITCCCRPPLAKRLQVGDQLIYITTKRPANGRCPCNRNCDHAHLIAKLIVVSVFPDHPSAAGWYGSQGLQVPSNCFVLGNGPLPLQQTAGFQWLPPQYRRRIRTLRAWDANYRSRCSRPNTSFVVCTVSFLDTSANAPVIGRVYLSRQIERSGRGWPALQNYQINSNAWRAFSPSIQMTP